MIGLILLGVCLVQGTTTSPWGVAGANSVSCPSGTFITQYFITGTAGTPGMLQNICFNCQSRSPDVSSGGLSWGTSGGFSWGCISQSNTTTRIQFGVIPQGFTQIVIATAFPTPTALMGYISDLEVNGQWGGFIGNGYHETYTTSLSCPDGQYLNGLTGNVALNSGQPTTVIINGLVGTCAAPSCQCTAGYQSTPTACDVSGATCTSCNPPPVGPQLVKYCCGVQSCNNTVAPGSYMSGCGGQGGLSPTCPVSDCTNTPLAGRYWSGGGTSATCPIALCPAGTYGVATGQNSVTGACLGVCLAGTYSSASGATSNAVCAPCNAATWSNTSGASVCSQCPGGTWGTATGATMQSAACLGCPSGTWGTTLGSTSCSLCPAGTWSTAIGSLNCSSQCSSGTYGTGLGMTSQDSCLLCSAGSTFAANMGQTDCSSCTICGPGEGVRAGE